MIDREAFLRKIGVAPRKVEEPIEVKEEKAEKKEEKKEKKSIFKKKKK